MQVSRHVTDLLLKSVDVMRDMLRSVQRKEPIDAQKVADLQFDLELAIAQKNQPVAAAACSRSGRRSCSGSRGRRSGEAGLCASLAHRLPSVSAVVRAR